MNEKIFEIIRGLSPRRLEVNPAMSLKNDLMLDSLALVELAVKVNDEFGIDLGEAADKGKTFNTVQDIVECLKK